MKNSEDNKGVVVRIYDTTGKDRSVELKFIKDVKRDAITDMHENVFSQIAVSGSAMTVDLPAYSVVTVKVEFV